MTEQHRPATDHSEEIPAGTWRGWIGRGRPREVTFMGRTAAFHDGGGICSPGRWPPGKRRLPTMGQEAVLDGVLGIMRADLVNSMGIDVDRLMMKVVTGNVEKPPFSEEALAGTRRILGEFFDIPERDQSAEAGQCMRLGFISGILRALSDPDHEYVKGVAD